MSFSEAIKGIPIKCIKAAALDEFRAKQNDFQKNWIETNRFNAAYGQYLLVPDHAGNLDFVLFGLGDEATLRQERLHLGALTPKLPIGDYEIETSDLDLSMSSLAWLLGGYQFAKYKGGAKPLARLVAAKGIDKVKLELIEKAVIRTQDLINEPANIMTPEQLSIEVKNLAEAYGAKFSEVLGDELISQNFPLIHAVGRASDYAPRLLELNWGKPEDPKLSIIGKGVCFDTGGLDIKPSSSMILMKKDMGGAANALGLAEMIMSQKLKIRLQVLIPAVENSISSKAFRPSDILISRSGKSVEVNNTDAEGRLVLADAITYAAESAPGQIISLATLTGAARVAVGPDLVPYYSDDDHFVSSLETAAREVEDPLWRMPFWPGYEQMIEAKNADLDNAPSGGFAGSITAALFLKRFAGGLPYAHFDLYGWTPNAKPGRPYGGAAQAIRAIFRSLEEIYR